MKIFASGGAAWSRRIGALGLALLFTSCATQKIDWASRVGNYTFDQAVLELGPPDKQAKLTDGTVVAEWITRRGYRQTYAVGGYYGPYAPGYYGSFYPSYLDSSSPDYFVRLTFDAEGKLKAWKKLAR